MPGEPDHRGEDAFVGQVHHLGDIPTFDEHDPWRLKLLWVESATSFGNVHPSLVIPREGRREGQPTGIFLDLVALRELNEWIIADTFVLRDDRHSCEGDCEHREHDDDPGEAEHHTV